MGKAGPKKIARYGDEFKLNAVKLSSAAGVLIKDVADSLCVHPPGTRYSSPLASPAQHMRAFLAAIATSSHQ